MLEEHYVGPPSFPDFISGGEGSVPYHSQNANQGEVDGDVGGDRQVHDRADRLQIKDWTESLQQGRAVWPRAV